MQTHGTTSFPTSPPCLPTALTIIYHNPPIYSFFKKKNQKPNLYTYTQRENPRNRSILKLNCSKLPKNSNHLTATVAAAKGEKLLNFGFWKWFRIRMEGINLLAKNSCESDNNSENVISSGDGRPPNPISGVYRHSPSSDHPVGPTSCKKCLLRHPSLVKKQKEDKFGFTFYLLL